jgi:hypothetical protein
LADPSVPTGGLGQEGETGGFVDSQIRREPRDAASARGFGESLLLFRR